MLLLEANVSPGVLCVTCNTQKIYLVDGLMEIHTHRPSLGLKMEMTIEGLVKNTSSKAEKHIHEIVAIWHLFRHMALQTC